MDDQSALTDQCPCLIKVVIQEAEELMRKQLRTRSLHWLHEQVEQNFSAKKREGIAHWLQSL